MTAALRQQMSEEESNKQVFTESIPHKEIIPMAEARERYRISNYHAPDDSILVMKGDLHTKGPVDQAWLHRQLAGMTWKNRLYGVVIDGNLILDGDVIDDEYIELFVQQDLVCDHIFSGNGIIEIKGNATVRYGIYGEYNDGSMDVYGKLITPYLVRYDHSMPRTAEGEFIYIDGGNGTERESISISTDQFNYDEDAQRFLSPAVWNNNDEFSADVFFEIIRKGENPFIKA
jgi:hypothetical protein